MFTSLDQATRWLETMLRQDLEEERSLLATVSMLSGKAQLAATLRSLLADRQWVALAAAQSYAHPLGFDRLTLLSPRSYDCQLSLHVWWPDQETTVEDIHNHRFSFASVVLDGALEMQTFEHANDSVPMEEYQATPGNKVGISQFRHVGDASLDCTLNSRMPAGSGYYLSSRTLHRIMTSSDTELTATLFLRGPIMQPSTAVFSDPSIRHRPDIARPTMAPQSFGERVASYLEALEASGDTEPASASNRVGGVVRHGKNRLGVQR